MNKKNKHKLIVAVIAGILIIGGASFYAGTKFTQGKVSGSPQATRPNQRAEDSQWRPGQERSSFGASNRTGQDLGNMTAGEIIKKDDSSITVKMTDGGSKIIFFTQATAITKTATATASDLAIAENVMVTGSANPDGSINAQFIQIGNTGSSRSQMFERPQGQSPQP